MKQAPDVQLWQLWPWWHISVSVSSFDVAFSLEQSNCHVKYIQDASRLNTKAALHHVCWSVCVWQVPSCLMTLHSGLMSCHYFTDVIHVWTLRYLGDSWSGDPADRLRTCSSVWNSQARDKRVGTWCFFPNYQNFSVWILPSFCVFVCGCDMWVTLSQRSLSQGPDGSDSGSRCGFTNLP